MGYKVRDYRLKALMSQEELSQKSGVSRVAISNIERGKVQYVSSKTLTALASALGVKIDDIIFEESV